MPAQQVDSFSTACPLCGRPVQLSGQRTHQHALDLPGEPPRQLVTIQDVRVFWCPRCLKGWEEACPPEPRVGA